MFPKINYGQLGQSPQQQQFAPRSEYMYNYGGPTVPYTQRQSTAFSGNRGQGALQAGFNNATPGKYPAIGFQETTNTQNVDPRQWANLVRGDLNAPMGVSDTRDSMSRDSGAMPKRTPMDIFFANGGRLPQMQYGNYMATGGPTDPPYSIYDNPKASSDSLNNLAFMEGQIRLGDFARNPMADISYEDFKEKADYASLKSDMSKELKDYYDSNVKRVHPEGWSKPYTPPKQDKFQEAYITNSQRKGKTWGDKKAYGGPTDPPYSIYDNEQASLDSLNTLRRARSRQANAFDDSWISGLHGVTWGEHDPQEYADARDHANRIENDMSPELRKYYDDNVKKDKVGVFSVSGDPSTPFKRMYTQEDKAKGLEYMKKLMPSYFPDKKAYGGNLPKAENGGGDFMKFLGSDAGGQAMNMVGQLAPIAMGMFNKPQQGQRPMQNPMQGMMSPYGMPYTHNPYMQQQQNTTPPPAYGGHTFGGMSGNQAEALGMPNYGKQY